MSIQPHEQRVIEEQKELEIKLNALSDYLDKYKTSTIGDKNLQLLHWQLGAMQIYSDVLKQRIAIFGDNQ